MLIPTHSTKCYLLDLPAELRLYIIELVLGKKPVKVTLIYDTGTCNECNRAFDITMQHDVNLTQLWLML